MCQCLHINLLKKPIDDTTTETDDKIPQHHRLMGYKRIPKNHIGENYYTNKKF
jgi:hypothetical protein